MDKFEYRPSTFGADTVNMDGDGGFVGTAEKVRSRAWARELGKSNLMSAARVAREVEVDFACDFAVADKLRECADADVLAGTPGTFVAQGEWRQRGYVLASEPKGVHFGWLSTSLTVALLDGAWWRLSSKSYAPEVDTSGEKVYQSATGTSVRTDGAAETGLHALTVYGESVQVGTPSPDSPVPITVVGSDNIDTISSHTFTDTSYWFTQNDHSYGTNLDDGWLRIAQNGVNLNVSPTKAAVADWLKESTTYTVLLEVRNSVITSPVRFHIYAVTNSLWAEGHYADITGDGVYRVTSVTKGDFSDSAITHLRLFLNANVTSGTSSFAGDVRISIYEGEYNGLYAPVGGMNLNVGSTQTLIDLDGNFLASLPDGTRDTVTVDSAGHCVLTKNVGKTTVDGSLAFGNTFQDSSTMGGNCTRITMNMSNFPTMKSGALNATNSYMSIAVFGTTAASGAPYPGVYSKTSTSGVYLTLPSTLTGAADVTAWLTANNFDFFYPLAEATTTDLGYIDMPDTFDGATVSVAAAVVPTITAEWEMARHVNLDYPMNYSHDYSKPSVGGSIDTGSLVPCKPRLVFYGPVTDPYIIVSGNKYQVNVSVPDGARVEIDGREKTVQMVLQDGTTTNEFANALRGSGEGGGEYIFQPIPAGDNPVTWDGSFGVDIGWYEEVGEPPWNQS